MNEDMTERKVKRIIKSNINLALAHRHELSDKFTDSEIAMMSINPIWKGDGQKVISDVLPGVNLGYGGNEQQGYGAGPTRLISSANYALRFTFTLEDVKLTTLNFLSFSGFSNQLSCMIDELSANFSEQRGIVKFKNPAPAFIAKNIIAEKGYMPVAEGSIALNPAGLEGTPTQILISNIRKNIFNYYGDISIHFVKALGLGGAFFPGKSGDAYNKEEMELFYSLRTSDLYAPKSKEAKSTSDNFVYDVSVNKEQFMKKAKAYKNIIQQITSRNINQREYHIVTVYNI